MQSEFVNLWILTHLLIVYEEVNSFDWDGQVYLTKKRWDEMKTSFSSEDFKDLVRLGSGVLGQNYTQSQVLDEDQVEYAKDCTAILPLGASFPSAFPPSFKTLLY